MNVQQLKQVYEMVDNIPFTRSKKNITRDFSDGVMMAELIYHYQPNKVELHSYPAASSVVKKMANWETLNSKVLKKMGIGLTKRQVEDIVNCVPLAIESYLYQVLKKFDSTEEEANVRQQISKVQPLSDTKVMQNSTANNNLQNSVITVTNIVQNKQSAKQIKKQPPNIVLGNENDEVFQLIQEIQNAYAELLKLQQKSKIKDQTIKSLQKKIEKMIFS